MAYERELTLGAAIARKAGELALEMREGSLGMEIKDDLSPVTLADKACEKLIVEQLKKAFPGDGLLGEEGAYSDGSNGRRWIIDPIDGTRDFIRGTRAWSVLLGLEEAGEVIAGHVYFPATHEMYSAAKGEGAWWDGRRIYSSSAKSKQEAMLCCNGLSSMSGYPFGNQLIDWMKDFWTVRSMGGCLDAMMVASGRADAWLEAVAKPWDLAPLKIIAEEAGCVTFDFKGNDTIYGGNFVIATPGLADEMRSFLGV